LSTNEPHPKAPMPTLFSISKGLPQDVDIIHAGTSVRVQIAGNLIALLCKEILDDIGAHVEIWNWRVNPRNKVRILRQMYHDDNQLTASGIMLTVHDESSVRDR